MPPLALERTLAPRVVATSEPVALQGDNGAEELTVLLSSRHPRLPAAGELAVDEASRRAPKQRDKWVGDRRCHPAIESESEWREAEATTASAQSAHALVALSAPV